MDQGREQAHEVIATLRQAIQNPTLEENVEHIYELLGSADDIMVDEEAMDLLQESIDQAVESIRAYKQTLLDILEKVDSSASL